MRILILGVSGLIGHKLFQELSSDLEVFGTLHKTKEQYGNIGLFKGNNIIENIDVCESDVLKGVLQAVNPDVILNCVGITRRKINPENTIEILTVNSVLPHVLAKWAELNHKRVIHFSSDCVFDGSIGNYSDYSPVTPKDLYGQSKALGEINYTQSLTIRSSFIGQELFGKTELLEWFLSQEGKEIKGYVKTLYSGVSTIFMSRVVRNIILNYPDLSGIYNLASEQPISKFALLSLAKEAFGVNVTIVPDTDHIHVPTLDASELKRKMRLTVPSWREMMKELASNNSIYSIV